MPGSASVGLGEEDGAFKRAPMPPFHTSAAHKLYQYWPRLRISLQLDGFDPLQFQRQCDEADHSLEHNLGEASDATVRPHHISEFIQRLYHQTNLIPQTIIYLLHMTPTYSLQNALSQIPNVTPDENGYIKLSELPLTLLLLLSVAFHYIPDISTDYGTTANSWKCFQLALTRLWTVHSKAEEYMLNSKLMVAVQLQIIYGRPYHAIGLLRQVGLSLSSTWTRSRYLSSQTLEDPRTHVDIRIGFPLGPSHLLLKCVSRHLSSWQRKLANLTRNRFSYGKVD